MEVNTKLFGQIEIDDEKIIEFPGGIVGFPDLNKFAIVHDSEKSDGSSLSFLLSLDELVLTVNFISKLFSLVLFEFLLL